MNFFYLAILTTILHWNVCLAQINVTSNHPSYSVDHFMDDHGLPQNSIKNMAADADGFVWLSTEKGLARFDGHSFRTFDKSNLPIKEQNFFSLVRRMDPQLSTGKLSSKLIIVAGQIENTAYRIEEGKVISDQKYFNKIYRKFKKGKTQNNSIRPFFGYPADTPDVWVIPVDNGEGSFFYSDKNKVKYFSNWEKVYEVPFASSNNLDFFTLGHELFYYEEDGTLTSVGRTVRRQRNITGDILLNPEYARDKKKYRLYWNIANNQAFFYLNKNCTTLNNQNPDR